jgi:hypothetical protein
LCGDVLGFRHLVRVAAVIRTLCQTAELGRDTEGSSFIASVFLTHGQRCHDCLVRAVRGLVRCPLKHEHHILWDSRSEIWSKIDAMNHVENVHTAVVRISPDVVLAFTLCKTRRTQMGAFLIQHVEEDSYRLVNCHLGNHSNAMQVRALKFDQTFCSDTATTCGFLCNVSDQCTQLQWIAEDCRGRSLDLSVMTA